MPAFIAALIGGIGLSIPSIVARVLTALSIGVVIYSGQQVLLGWVGTEVRGGVSGLPSDVLAWIILLKVDICINILLSALAARLIVDGVAASGIAKWGIKQ
jgi:hypothetical protein